jgi:rfaE bifunctional protein nucleotidyltransferase chain/domain
LSSKRGKEDVYPEYCAMLTSKIHDVDALVKVLDSHRSEGTTIVHCHGVFDLLHVGHIRHFKQARRMGDMLVVTVTPDRFVDKGPDRPAFPEALRAEAIASLSYVDYVAINKWPTAQETLRALRPHVYVKGSEFKDDHSDTTGKIDLERMVAQEIGAKVAFTEDIVFSSSNLINRYFSNLSAEINQYLRVFRGRFGLEQILCQLGEMASLNVLVIGDTILDEYQYCETLGLSSKDPMMAVKYRSHDLFAGGVLAVANHVANFAGKVTLVTVLGERDGHDKFVRSSLRDNVTPHFWIQPGAPTIVKRRFIEVYSLNKLFEIYIMNDSGLPSHQDNNLCEWLCDHLSEYDVVIAADFGHGAISAQAASCLSRKARFLAINTQANAGNRGYHSITKYERLHFGCVAEHELRLQMRDKNGPLQPMMEELAATLDCRKLIVTRGMKGCLARDSNGVIVEVPAFAQKAVDRIGAGDTFFSITSLAAAQGSPAEILGFLGSCAGSLAVGYVGNAKPLDRRSLEKYITALIK